MTKLSGETFEVTIEKLVYGGYGLGRHQGKVVFVPFSIPGDRLLARSIEEKKKFVRAEMKKLLVPGPGRETPRCVYFGRCGGCQWQNLEYGRQVETKRQILEDLLHHKFPQTRDLIVAMKASPQDYGYRSRARLQLRGSGVESKVGFYRFLSHSVEDIEMCPLFKPALNRALASLRASRRTGSADPGLRQVEIACSDEDDAWAFAGVEMDGEEDASSLHRPEEETFHIPSLRRKVGEYAYEITPAVFFQANDYMLGELTGVIQKLALEVDRSAALDLYAGVGLFSLPLAQDYRKVVAVENSRLAARLCTRNGESAGLTNLETYCADVACWMREAEQVSPPAFDLIVLDPPRSGAGPEVMERIRDWAPRTVIYVACDPQTLCRDISVLTPSTYEINSVTGLDLFPHSYHFETIVRLFIRGHNTHLAR